MGLKTTTVGWFPKPVELRRARWRFAEGEIDEAERVAAETAAVRDAVKLQESVGLDLLVDGQMDRGDGVGLFGERLEGMEPAGLVRCFGNRYYRRPRIVGDLSRDAAISVDPWKRAQEMTERPVKAVLPGPYTLMDWSYDEHYGSRERCCRALAAIVADEVRDLVAAGAAEIQIDEPAIGARPEEMDLVAASLAQVTAAASGRARTWVHAGFADPLPVIDRVLALPADGLLLGLVSSGFAALDALGALPQDKLLGAGIVDVHADAVESAAALRARAERLLERVPSDRLWLMPDAGMRTLTARVAEAKLRALAEVAAAL